jgi:hypothetical protein
VFPARYELNSYIVFRKRLVSKRLSRHKDYLNVAFKIKLHIREPWPELRQDSNAGTRPNNICALSFSSRYSARGISFEKADTSTQTALLCLTLTRMQAQVRYSNS